MLLLCEREISGLRLFPVRTKTRSVGEMASTIKCTFVFAALPTQTPRYFAASAAASSTLRR